MATVSYVNRISVMAAHLKAHAHTHSIMGDKMEGWSVSVNAFEYILTSLYLLSNIHKLRSLLSIYNDLIALDGMGLVIASHPVL